MLPKSTTTINRDAGQSIEDYLDEGRRLHDKALGEAFMLIAEWIGRKVRSTPRAGHGAPAAVKPFAA